MNQILFFFQIQIILHFEKITNNIFIMYKVNSITFESIK